MTKIILHTVFLFSAFLSDGNSSVTYVTEASDSQPSFTLIESKKEQRIKLESGKSKIFHQIDIDEDMIVHNDLTIWEKETKSLIIKETGYYELSGSFYFNPNTSQLDFSRAGINFVFCKNEKDKWNIISGKRHTFYKENSELYSTIDIAPAVVRLEKEDRIYVCINAGLLEKDLFFSKIGTDKNQNAYSYRIQIIRLNHS